MKQIKSLSEKRLIAECQLNGEKALFLMDTGATVGLIDRRAVKEYGLQCKRDYPGTLTGAGGELRGVKICDTFAYLMGKPLTQFLVADIGDVVESIERETGLRITGIVGLPQMKLAGIRIDANDNEIIIEEDGD